MALLFRVLLFLSLVAWVSAQACVPACQNGGACDTLSATCNCANGFGGDACEFAISFSMTSGVTVDEDVGDITVTVSRAETGYQLDLTITSSGSATNPADFLVSRNLLTLATGAASASMILRIEDDMTVEGEETVTITATAPDGVTTRSQTWTIRASDSVSSMVTSGLTFTEGDGTASVDFECSMSTDIDSTTFDVTALDGSAVATSDYTFSPTTYTCSNGGTFTVTVGLVTDNVPETAETFSLALTSTRTAATQVTATINDDDPILIAAPLPDSVIEGSSGFNLSAVTFTFVNGVPAIVPITATVRGVTAVADVDFELSSLFDSVTINYNESSPASRQNLDSLTITFPEDNTVEPDKFLSVIFSSDYLLTGNITTQIRLIDNEAEVIMLSGPDSVSEAAGTATYTFRREFTGRPVTVTYTVTAGSIDTTKYNTNVMADTGSITFTALQNETTFDVTLEDDMLRQAGVRKTFTISASGTLVEPIPDKVVNITEDDAYGVAFDGDTLTEGDSTSLSFTRDSTDGELTIDVQLMPGSAQAGSDYTDASTSLTFTDGQASRSLNIQTTEDNVFEDVETFSVAITSTEPLKTASLAARMLTITDDDTESVTISGGGNFDEDVGVVTFTLDRTADFESLDVLVSTVIPPLALFPIQAGDIVMFTDQTVTFPTGETSVTFNVTINNDDVVERDEEFNVLVNSPDPIPDDEATVTIVNDDLFTVTLTGDTVTEGDSATVMFSRDYTVGTLDIDISTSDGTAVAGDDYTAISTTLTFADGMMTVSTTIDTTNDLIYEDEESFTVSVAPSAMIHSASLMPATVTIEDNNPEQIDLSGPDAVLEDAGSVEYSLTRRDTLRDVTVTYTVTAGPVDTTKYNTNVMEETGSVSFSVGDVTKNFTVTLEDDNVIQVPKSFTISFTGVLVEPIPDKVVQITEDDDYGVTFTGATVAEGESFNIELTRDTDAGSLTVGFLLTDVTTSGSSDYTDPSSTVTFNNGDTVQSVTIQTTQDMIRENTETFNLSLTSTSTLKAASLTPRTMTITDNDTEIVTISGGGNVDEDVGVVTVTLNRNADFESLDVLASTVIPSVQYPIQAGDIVMFTDQTVTFPIGETSVSFNVTINNDDVPERNEVFEVTVRASGIGSATVNVTIVNDDPFSISFNNSQDEVTVMEGGSVEVVYKRDAAIGPLTIDITATDGTATQSSDYTDPAQSITFLEGESTASVVISIMEDDVYEDTETFMVSITDSASLKTSSLTPLTVRITDNDVEELTLSSDLEILEDAGALNVTLSRTATFANLTVNASTLIPAMGRNLISADDIVMLRDMPLTFLVGTASIEFQVNINDDEIAEPDEEFVLSIQPPPPIDDVEIEVTILNDDLDEITFPRFLGLTENGGSKRVRLTRKVTGQELFVQVNTQDGTATAGLDYTPLVDVNVTFEENSLTAYVEVFVLDDGINENDETFTLRATGMMITPSEGEFIVVDNEGSKPFDCRRTFQNCYNESDYCDPHLPFCFCLGDPEREGYMCNIFTGEKGCNRTCSNHGECQNKGDSLECACSPGWYGEDCEIYFLQVVCSLESMIFIADPHGDFSGVIYQKDRHGVENCTSKPVPDPPNPDDAIDDNLGGFYVEIPTNSGPCGAISAQQEDDKITLTRYFLIQYNKHITTGLDQLVRVTCYFNSSGFLINSGMHMISNDGPFVNESVSGVFTPVTVSWDVNDVIVTSATVLPLAVKLCATFRTTEEFGGIELINIEFNNSLPEDPLRWRIFTDGCVEDSNVTAILADRPFYPTLGNKRVVKFCFYVFKFVNSLQLTVEVFLKVCVDPADCDQTCSNRVKRQTTTARTQTLATTFSISDPNVGSTAVLLGQPDLNNTYVTQEQLCNMPFQFVPTIICLAVVILFLVLLCIFLTYRLLRRSRKKSPPPSDHPSYYLRSSS